MQKTEEEEKPLENTSTPSQLSQPNIDFSWISHLSKIPSEKNVDSILKVIEKDIELKEQAMQYEKELDKERLDKEQILKEHKIEIEKIQLERQDYFDRWGMILSFAIVVFSLVVGGMLIARGYTYGGVLVVVIGAGLGGAGAINKIAEKIMARVVKSVDKI